MLLNFSLKNFKSFKEARVDFKPSKSPSLNYSLLKSGDHKALSAMVFYGANASGKSNIIKGLQTLKQFILYGKIAGDYYSCVTMHNFNVAPSEPIGFGIEFENDGEKYSYVLRFNFEKVNESIAKVEYEQLHIGGRMVFERTGRRLSGVKDAEKLEKSLLDDDLFLCNGFKLCDIEAYKTIYYWFENKLLIYGKDDEFGMGLDALDVKTIENLAKDLEEVSSDIHVLQRNTSAPLLLSEIKNEYYDVCIPSSVYESSGTIRLLSLLPRLISAFRKGAAIFVDELDMSLHPMAGINLINIFHNDEINRNRAQLIFTTYDPIYLDAGILRTDEIYNVIKDRNGDSSINSIRNKSRITQKSSIMNKYMRNEFGGIPDIDFSDLFMAKNE